LYRTARRGDNPGGRATFAAALNGAKRMRRCGGGVTKRQAGRCGLAAAALAFVLQLVAWAWSPAMLSALAAGTAGQEIAICSG